LPEFPVSPPELTDVWLSQIDLQDNPSFRRVSAGVDLHYSVHTRLHVEVGEQTLARFTLKIGWRESDDAPLDQDIEGPFAVEMQITGEFATPNPAAFENQIERWLHTNAPHLLWTYARAYLSTATGLTRHMPLTLFTIVPPSSRAFEPETGEQQAIDTPE
jgi:hypothetical protein